MPLPYSWIQKARALSDQILVRRVRQGYIWQGIIQIPETYVGFTKNANALVVDIGRDVNLPHLQTSDVVWVAQGVTRKIEFEDEDDSPWEPALYACYPAEIWMNLGTYRGEVAAAEPSEHPHGRWPQKSGMDKALEDSRSEEVG